jgi:hypothetical protein
MLSIDCKRDKNGINTGLFYIKTGLLGNGRKTPFSTSANTKTGSRKYGNGQKNIENETERYGKNSVRFHPRRETKQRAVAVRKPGKATTPFLSNFFSFSFLRGKGFIFLINYKQCVIKATVIEF